MKKEFPHDLQEMLLFRDLSSLQWQDVSQHDQIN